MRNLKMTVLAITVGLFAATVSHAAVSSEKSANMKQIVTQLKTQCGADIDQLCPNVTPGEGRIAACLDSKQDQLSPACKTQWGQTKSSISHRMDKAEVAFRKNCGDDVQKFCAEVPSGKGRLLDCLDQHKDSLSNSCKGFEAKLSQKMAEFVG